MNRFLPLLLCLLACCCQMQAITLFADGRTSYTIVVAKDASESEQTAARELQSYLQQISQASFPLSNDLQTRGDCIIVGHNARTATLTQAPRPADADESFTYQTIGNHLLIYGGRLRGTMYGVFAFLENELGVRWYTHDYTKVPRRETWKTGKLSHTERPAITYRYTMYYRCADDVKWAAHNRNNFYWNLCTNAYGGSEACLGAHTLKELLPKDEFFARHPEYYALRQGKRKPDGQPCLSNPTVLRIVTERMLKRIAENPKYLLYDVSQCDNSWYCECANCQEIERRYGNRHSGLMLWFVNQVAEAVEKRYPSKKLCTFAYRYTRQAPKNIVPRDNVVIRLCDIECCFAHPLERCPQNSAFMTDLHDWGQLTRNIFVWDYVVNFQHYIAPYPNFDVLKSNIQTFARHGVSTILEQGQRQSFGGEFAELKAWVIAHLLWNPKQNANQLAQQFIQDYYGPAGPYIKQYFLLCRQQVKSDTHIHQKGDEAIALYNDDFIRRAESLLDKALSLCPTPPLRTRVEHVQAQILYLKTKKHPIRSRLDGTTTAFTDYVRRHRPHVRESQSADNFLQAF